MMHVRGIGQASSDGDVVALINRAEDVGDGLAHRFRGDAVRGIVGLLLLAAAVGLAKRVIERLGHRIRVENHPPVDVAGGAADGLHQAGLRTKIALFVGIQDGDQRAFRNVQALAQ